MYHQHQHQTPAPSTNDLVRRLQSVDSKQDTVRDGSRALLLFDRDKARGVSIWHHQVLEAAHAHRAERLLGLFYVANDVLLSTATGFGADRWAGHFLNRVGDAMRHAVTSCFQVGETQTVERMARLPGIWRERQVFTNDLCGQLCALFENRRSSTGSASQACEQTTASTSAIPPANAAPRSSEATGSQTVDQQIQEAVVALHALKQEEQDRQLAEFRKRNAQDIANLLEIHKNRMRLCASAEETAAMQRTNAERWAAVQKDHDEAGEVMRMRFASQLSHWRSVVQRYVDGLRHSSGASSAVEALLRSCRRARSCPETAQALVFMISQAADSAAVGSSSSAAKPEPLVPPRQSAHSNYPKPWNATGQQVTSQATPSWSNNGTPAAMPNNRSSGSHPTSSSVPPKNTTQTHQMHTQQSANSMQPARGGPNLTAAPSAPVQSTRLPNRGPAGIASQSGNHTMPSRNPAVMQSVATSNVGQSQPLPPPRHQPPHSVRPVSLIPPQSQARPQDARPHPFPPPSHPPHQAPPSNTPQQPLKRHHSQPPGPKTPPSQQRPQPAVPLSRPPNASQHSHPLPRPSHPAPFPPSPPTNRPPFQPPQSSSPAALRQGHVSTPPTFSQNQQSHPPIIASQIPPSPLPSPHSQQNRSSQLPSRAGGNGESRPNQSARVAPPSVVTTYQGPRQPVVSRPSAGGVAPHHVPSPQSWSSRAEVEHKQRGQQGGGDRVDSLMGALQQLQSKLTPAAPAPRHMPGATTEGMREKTEQHAAEQRDDSRGEDGRGASTEGVDVRPVRRSAIEPAYDCDHCGKSFRVRFYQNDLIAKQARDQHVKAAHGTAAALQTQDASLSGPVHASSDSHMSRTQPTTVADSVSSTAAKSGAADWIDPDAMFIPASRVIQQGAGKLEGYVLKVGAQGLGYYKIVKAEAKWDGVRGEAGEAAEKSAQETENERKRRTLSDIIKNRCRLDEETRKLEAEAALSAAEESDVQDVDMEIDEDDGAGENGVIIRPSTALQVGQGNASSSIAGLAQDAQGDSSDDGEGEEDDDDDDEEEEEELEEGEVREVKKRKKKRPPQTQPKPQPQRSVAKPTDTKPECEGIEQVASPSKAGEGKAATRGAAAVQDKKSASPRKRGRPRKKKIQRKGQGGDEQDGDTGDVEVLNVSKYERSAAETKAEGEAEAGGDVAELQAELPALPLSLGAIEILSFGELNRDPAGYFSDKVVLPVGFRSARMFTGLRDRHSSVRHVSEILPGPEFVVRVEDDPPYEYRGTTPTQPWLQAMMALNKRHGMRVNQRISGLSMFGFGSNRLLALLKRLPGYHDYDKVIRQASPPPQLTTKRSRSSPRAGIAPQEPEVEEAVEELNGDDNAEDEDDPSVREVVDSSAPEVVDESSPAEAPGAAASPPAEKPSVTRAAAGKKRAGKEKVNTSGFTRHEVKAGQGLLDLFLYYSVAEQQAHPPPAPPVEAGMRVKAKWMATEGGVVWYDGVLQAVNEDGTVDVLYDDGDTEQGVQRRHVQTYKGKDRKKRGVEAVEVPQPAPSPAKRRRNAAADTPTAVSTESPKTAVPMWRAEVQSFLSEKMMIFMQESMAVDLLPLPNPTDPLGECAAIVHVVARSSAAEGLLEATPGLRRVALNQGKSQRAPLDIGGVVQKLERKGKVQHGRSGYKTPQQLREDVVRVLGYTREAEGASSAAWARAKQLIQAFTALFRARIVPGLHQGMQTFEHGGHWLGHKVRVYWEDDMCWYSAVIDDYDGSERYHLLYEDDGEEEWMELPSVDAQLIPLDWSPPVNGRLLEPGDLALCDPDPTPTTPGLLYHAELEQVDVQAGRIKASFTNWIGHPGAWVVPEYSRFAMSDNSGLAQIANGVCLTVGDSDSVRQMAKRVGVEDWKLLLMNKICFPDIALSSKLRKGTTLMLPLDEACRRRTWPQAATSEKDSNKSGHMCEWAPGSSARVWKEGNSGVIQMRDRRSSGELFGRLAVRAGADGKLLGATVVVDCVTSRHLGIISSFHPGRQEYRVKLDTEWLDPDLGKGFTDGGLWTPIPSPDVSVVAEPDWSFDEDWLVEQGLAESVESTALAEQECIAPWEEVAETDASGRAEGGVDIMEVVQEEEKCQTDVVGFKVVREFDGMVGKVATVIPGGDIVVVEWDDGDCEDMHLSDMVERGMVMTKNR